MYSYVASGLFERHKLIFAAQLCFKIQQVAGEIDPVAFNFLLRGPRESTDNPLHEWLADEYWQMACGDDDVTHWTLPAHRGIKLFEAVQGCSDDGLGSRHWHVNDRGFGQCVYGCGCYTGCNSITMVARQINTEAECNTKRANGIALKWDDVNHRCSYTEVEAEQKCRAAKDMFEQTQLQRPCGVNERYNYKRCDPCPPDEFRELKNHFLPNCVKCSDSNKCGDFGPYCRERCNY